MNILWTVNTLMPEIANELGLKSMHAISWVDAMSKRLTIKKGINLSIATRGDVEHVISKTIDNLNYFVIPQDCNRKDYWTEVLNECRPHVIHIYGSENDQNRLLVENHSQDYPIMISLQGIVSEYYKHYYAGIPFTTMLRYTTLRDVIRPSGFFRGRKHMKNFVPNEQWMLCHVKAVEGRSTWDRVSALNINPDLKYYYCPRMIRSAFWEGEWAIDKVERHSIFVHQGDYPIKGIHFVFEALAKLKAKYPDIKLYVSGKNFIEAGSGLRKYLPTGYVKYLNDLIRELNIKNNILFTGYLSAAELTEKLEVVNTVIIPSAIENAPNSLAEAQIVGTPTIATFVGGNMDMLKHNEEGYLYCYNEPNMLAEYISRIFDNDELANSFSSCSRKTARMRHDPDTLEKMLLAIYDEFSNANKI